MKNTNENIEKICNFYVSDTHFAVMILPFVNKEIDYNKKIIPIFEDNNVENVKQLTKQFDLSNKQEILNINWKKSDKNSLVKSLEEKLKSDSENIIIVNGTDSYIKYVNNEINSLINTQQLSDKKLKVIDCYELEKNKNKLGDIVKNYNEILDTSGIHELSKNTTSAL